MPLTGTLFSVITIILFTRWYFCLMQIDIDLCSILV